MNDQVVEFTIKDGKIHFDAVGFEGVGCEEATKFLMELGDSKLEYKPEHMRRQPENRLLAR